MLSETQKAIFLDSLGASKAILIDKKENFLKKITPLDMCIQMKKNYPKGVKRSSILIDYKTYLQKDVVGFTKSEKALVEKCMMEATKLSNSINPNIVPPVIELIKTKGNHYGPGVYYTRDHRIIIPYDALVTKGKNKAEVEAALTQTLLHEIFHIFSRNDVAKRKKLYAVIGFKNIGSIPLDMKPALAERVLINPDGVNLAQVIDLRTDSSTISAIPVITSSKPSFSEDNPSFFSYLKFDLYQVVRGRGGIKVISNEDGTSTLNLAEMKDFFRKIGDNTDYIIHPDEILADNFMFLALAEKDPSSLDKFSKEGKFLLKAIERILRGGNIAP